MQNLHKDNAILTVAALVYAPDFANNPQTCGTRGAIASTVGMSVSMSSATGALVFTVVNSGTVHQAATSAAVPTGVPVFVACSVSETAGAIGGIFAINNAIETFDATYSSPATGNATNTMKIGIRGDAVGFFTNGSRLYLLLVWEGVALTAGQLAALFNASRGRVRI